MKATNSLEGLGIRIVSVVFISIGVVKLLVYKATTIILLAHAVKRLK